MSFNPLRSILPLGVSGRRSTTTKAAGTMGSGKRNRRNPRSERPSGLPSPGAGATPAPEGDATAMAGVPMLLLPFQMEQRLNAARAKAAGFAHVVQKENVRAGFARALRRALDDAAFTRVAGTLAKRYRGQGLRRNVGKIVSDIEVLCASERKINPKIRLNHSPG